RIRRLPHFPKLGGSDIADPMMRRVDPSLPFYPIKATASMLELAEQVRRRLPMVTQPLFVAHGRHDHAIPFAAAQELVRGVATPAVQFLPLERSYHVITLDLERERLADELGAFLEKRI